ncbi:hypothetical protein CYY_005952 [Polysphondylium violaceum]|uniref:Transmembrane protein n=1 Tax=Polysphondylium violaceum TaxID=133409 RepID=A0A8J4URU1_9MYCE|nr:hypothetical protein CYY_005952 [Polysphondylium violaceum]
MQPLDPPSKPFSSPFLFEKPIERESSIEFNNFEYDLDDDDDDSLDHANILVEPPRATGLLMKFIFLFHPILLFLFVLPGILTFWVLFIAENSLKPFFYIVFLMAPLVLQFLLLFYHSRSFLFLNYGRQAVSRKYTSNTSQQFGQLYQLVDIQSQTVVTLLDHRIADEKAMYLYIPVSKEVFNMAYFESTFRVNPLGHWQVILTWKALLSFFVFAVMLMEFILLFILRHWFMSLF